MYGSEKCMTIELELLEPGLESSLYISRATREPHAAPIRSRFHDIEVEFPGERFNEFDRSPDDSIVLPQFCVPQL